MDEWIARFWFPRTGQPVFRLYGWSPYAVSLGYHQPIEQVDRKALEAAGFHLVRRPTGGRAVFHAEEITYCVVMDVTGQSVHTAYERVSRTLVSGLRAAGYDVQFARKSSNLASLYQSKDSIPCFAASGEYEIQMRNRKLVGSAQRRFTYAGGRVVALQHGSILTGPSHRRLVEFLMVEDTVRRRLYDKLCSTTIDLAEITDVRVDTLAVKNHILNSFMCEFAEGRYITCDHSFFSDKMYDASHMEFVS